MAITGTRRGASAGRRGARPRCEVTGSTLVAAAALAVGAPIAFAQYVGGGVGAAGGTAAAFLAPGAGADAGGQGKILVPTIGLNLTLTNNVNLEPAGGREGDLITTITPGLGINWRGARTRLEGMIAVPILVYARTGAENNEVRPQAQLLGRAELVDNFLFVEGSASVSQQFATPFGPTPPSLGTVTDNRYNSQTYRVTPYIRGRTTGGVEYELRNDNIWTNLGETSFSASNSYTNGTYLDVFKRPEPLGFNVHYERVEVRFSGQQPILTQLARLRIPYRVSPQLEVDATVGYEDNQYPFTEYTGPIYGGGFRWRPNARMALDAFAEHRFFGTSYLVTFTWRNPLTSWAAQFSRNTTSYPQQLAQLGTGTIVPLVLDQLFASRIPDQAQRIEYIQQFMQERGLPVVLADPVSIFTQQIYLLESASITGGRVGVRNSVFVTFYRNRSEAISGAGQPVPPPLAGALDNTQLGATAVWSSQLGPQLSLTSTITGYRTTANAGPSAATNQGFATMVLSSPIAPRTTGYGGVRYQLFRSDVAPDYDEAAVFVGLTYAFY